MDFQEAIVNSEISYRRLFESSTDGKIILDAKTGVILNVNPFFTRMTGLSQQQLVGQGLMSFDFFKEIASDYNEFRDLLQDEYLFYEDLSLYASDKHMINVDFVAHRYAVDNQKLIYCNIRDTTARRKTKRQVKLLNKAIDQSPVTVVITDKQGNIEYVNPKFTEVSGYTFEEVRGKNPRLAHAGDHPVGFYQNLWDTILSGKDWHGEFHNRRKNGESYWESATISPIFNSRGEIIYFIAVKEDITEKKEILGNLIRTKEKAEESDRLKSAFLANMSHEIRTPMNGILGFASLLKEPLLSGEEQQEYISVIEESGARMLNIINEIVEISKIESGVMKVNLKKFNVNEQIEHVYNLFKPDIEAKGMKFFLKKSLSLNEATINSDPDKLSAILMNLVKNAIKYSREGSIELGYERKGNLLEFYVKDTGIGISPDKQEAIFNRFVQADMGHKRAYEGAGLGLSITKAYVEMLDGKIWLNSKEGIGTEFYFTIPYSDEPAKLNPVQIEAPVNDDLQTINNLKILIAEDDKFSAILLTKLVQKFSREVLTARNGLEAVQVCRDNADIDLILMDIHMPEMNGYEATRQIRQFNPEVVIIAQTAFVFSHDRDEAIRAGCNEYISKPVEKKLLSTLLKKHFESPVYH